jgi:hypothetical protein
VEYIKEKVLSLGYKDLKQISKTELICMSLRRLWIYSSLRVLLTIQRSALFARSSKRIPLIISKAGGKHCRFSHKNYTMKYKLNIDTLVIDGYTGTGDIQLTEGDDNTQ